MNKRLRTILQYLFFLGLGIFFAWLSLKNLNKEKTDQIKAALRDAKHWLIIPVFAMLFLGHLVRALRWKLLMEPMGYRPSTSNTFFAVMIGYLTNQAVPRLGEVLKCTVLARYEKIPADKLIGTIIIERIIDALTLLIVFGITLGIQPHLYSEMMEALFNSKQNPQEKKMAGWVFGLIILGILLLIISAWMLIKKKTVKDVGALLPMIGQRILTGIRSVRQLQKRGLFLFYTVVLWSIYLFGGYIGFTALQDTQQYGIREAFTVLSAGSIGMIASPGGIGAYAYLLQQTMQMYGLSEVIALAFGWILWMAQTAVILIGGIFSFAALPYYNKKRPLHEQTRPYTE
jgi:glycosyltransferase 2 family protein